MGARYFLYDALVVASVLLGLFFYRRRSSRTGRPLPPGPPKLPLLGNLLDLPSSFEWETFQAWGKKYNSDILHLTAAGQSLIVLNSIEVAHDLLERRSAIYSARPKFTIVNEFMGLSYLMPFMTYGTDLKERRRLFQRGFHPSNESHKGSQVVFARRLLLQVLEDPKEFIQHIRHAVGGMLYSITYGGETMPSNDPYIGIAEEVSRHLGDSAVPSTMILEIFPFLFPILSYILPSSAFTKSRQEWRKLGSRFRDDPFQNALRLMDSNAFVARALEIVDDDEEQHGMIKDVGAIVFIGGSSTMNATLNTFVLAMLCFPDAQAKAHQELDRVIGRGRLPDFSDERHLPYLGALLKEVTRWQPAGPLAIPHFLENDDEYNGYHIPRQSIIIGNVWAMLHDEKTYPDPSSFKPERFLKDGLPDPSVRDPATVAFGFGRRICPGVHIAQSNIWIVAASILWAFEISPVLDEKGREIQPTVEYHSSVTFGPLPFKCTIKPRHDHAEGLIRANE